MVNHFVGEKKRKKKDGGGAGSSGVRPKNCPLSERQQLALLMQMTAGENSGINLLGRIACFL